jgi:hypothetical protein
VVGPFHNTETHATEGAGTVVNTQVTLVQIDNYGP